MKKPSISSFLLFALVFCGLLFFFSCGRKKSERENIFRYNESAGISTLDPAYAKNQAIMWPVHQLFSRLVEVDDNMTVMPSVAHCWEISEDKLTFTFHLRRDIYFHDDPVFPGGKGRRLDADDVAYSFSRIIDPQVASPGAWIFNGKVDSILPFFALNDSTFQLKLLRPFIPLLGMLSMPYCSIVPREGVEGYAGQFRRHPVGSGPFRFRSWTEGQALVLNRNPDYFEKDEAGNNLPYLDGIFITFHGSKATEFLEFRQGRLDMINDIDPSFKDELLTRSGNLRKEWKDKLQLFKGPFLNTEYLGILADTTHPLLRNSPLRQKLFRQALNYSIDKRKMIFYLRNSIGIPAEAGFVPLGLPEAGGRLSGYQYDPSMAAKLLDSCGFSRGNIPGLKLLIVPAYAAMGTFMAEEFTKAGIPVEVEVVQKSLLLEQMAKSQAVFFRGSWIADYPDAENYLSVFYGKNPAPPNYTRFKNKMFDRLYESAITEINDSLRLAKYRVMDSIIVEEAPVVPLFYDMVIQLVQPWVEGYRVNAGNMLNLRKVRSKR